jgi:hypothetical protein
VALAANLHNQIAMLRTAILGNNRCKLGDGQSREPGGEHGTSKPA